MLLSVGLLKDPERDPNLKNYLQVGRFGPVGHLKP